MAQQNKRMGAENALVKLPAAVNELLSDYGRVGPTVEHILPYIKILQRPINP